MEILETGNDRVFAFRRIAGKDKVRVVVNLSADPVTVRIPAGKPISLKGWGWRID
jgi:hypothetical protein